MLANFTRFGWGLTRALPDLVEELRESLRGGLEEGRARLEQGGIIESVGGGRDEGTESEGPLPPLSSISRNSIGRSSMPFTRGTSLGLA